MKKDFERIDNLEKEVKYIHEKFGIILDRFDQLAELNHAVLRIGEYTLVQNERLIKDLEAELKK